ncbi:hypothetical protein [Silvibacterium acidisoli]|uniref:hypothetical protein n=1 Tax=Acidobacteriaceae bacterium ZG23-2 TaxID=2883246 RepID=UPI00406CF6FE
MAVQDQGQGQSGQILEQNEAEASSVAALSPNRAAVRKTLREILGSAPFRSSRQCQDLLRYVVEHSLKGNETLLRERVIGSEVFGRAPDYDTANDPIVRSRIAEVRKRLAQFYQSEGRNAGTLIEIPSGTYRAKFESLTPITAVVEQPLLAVEEAVPTASSLPVLEPRRALRVTPYRFFWGLLAAMLLLVAGTYIWMAIPSAQERAFHLFWAPALKSPVPVLVYTGTNVVYRFSPDFLERYRHDNGLPNQGPEFVVQLPSIKSIDPKDLSASSNTYVSTGDVLASNSITSMLARYGKPYQLRFAGDISAGDVHTGPTVLIGAFNNGWTLGITRNTPFTFLNGDTIADRQDKSRFWKVRTGSGSSTLDDYAILSRLILPQSNSIMLTAAGIGQYGTQAASEILVDRKKIADILRNAPKNWADENMQVVIHVKVVDDEPGQTEVVATRFW